MRSRIILGLVALLMLTLSSLAFGDIADGLVFLMTFDEGKGDKVRDLSGFGNDGTVVGKADWVTGKFAGGFHFDGSTHITVPNAEPLSKLTHPMSVAAWVNPDVLGGWRNIVEMDGNAGWKFGFNNSPLVWTTYHVLDFTAQTPIETKTWTHAAATWDGKEAIIYVNGKPDSPIAGGGVINVEKEPSLDIGYRRTSNASFFQGIMDDLCIYNRKIDQNEVKELMNGFAKLLAVGAQGKLATKWGELKTR